MNDFVFFFPGEIGMMSQYRIAKEVTVKGEWSGEPTDLTVAVNADKSIFGLVIGSQISAASYRIDKDIAPPMWFINQAKRRKGWTFHRAYQIRCSAEEFERAFKELGLIS
ncbi:MAG TPA: hypothetical protein VLT90_12965 [Terriglobales bacterium]|nr:hypothetical protein [Terriglobales bacterium]